MHILRAPAVALAVLAFAFWNALRVHAEPPPQPAAPAIQEPAAPLRCRQRVGVVLAETQAEPRRRDAGALAPKDLRWLALRSEQNALDDVSRWPAEPVIRVAVNPALLAEALAQLCPPVVSAALLRELAEGIVSEGERQSVDPMLLGALIYQQSGCEPRRESSWGVGLTMLNPGLLPAGYADARAREARDALLDPHTNLRVAAELLRRYSDECAQLDAACHSVPHRHPVSHFIWGDRVRGTAAEDAVLTARRRLIDYYRGALPSQAPVVAVGTLTASSPLDGPPRIVTSGLGAARDFGQRVHAGVDFLSRVGEPVRAIADGRVMRAGANLRDGSLVDVAPLRAALVPRESFGARGLFVEISHADDYRSIYAHLASYVVQEGEEVRRGQLIGYVGRTGIQESDPHLHFGLFHKADVVDPRHALAPFLFAPALERRGASHAEVRAGVERP